jgi:Fe-Mn family superoxide dismutase
MVTTANVMPIVQIKNNNTTMHFTLPMLPYAPEALAPAMSRETIDYHYGKHYKGYLDNVNRLIEGTRFERMTLEDIVRHADGALYNNAAQALNHQLFFEGLTPRQHDMPQALRERIVHDFGSEEAFREEFSAAATSLFGSGWVWLVESKDGKLSIVSTPNAVNPINDNLHPVMVLDVWEHAYYIDYRNRRADFIKNFWDVVDWDKVASRLHVKHPSVQI